MGTLVKVAKTTDLPPGQGKTVEANGREIALFNVGGTFYAIDNTCKHRGGSLGEGELDGTVVTCPLHAWTYDVSSAKPTNRWSSAATKSPGCVRSSPSTTPRSAPASAESACASTPPTRKRS